MELSKALKNGEDTKVLNRTGKNIKKGSNLFHFWKGVWLKTKLNMLLHCGICSEVSGNKDQPIHYFSWVKFLSTSSGTSLQELLFFSQVFTSAAYIFKISLLLLFYFGLFSFRLLIYSRKKNRRVILFLPYTTLFYQLGTWIIKIKKPALFNYYKNRKINLIESWIK